ncbi:MAG: cyclic pyranopterin monophosphate synthase MoaC [Nitrospinaceae bacterium]
MTHPLTHFNEEGRARMVDVGNKNVTQRTAVATGVVYMQPETLQLIQEGQIKKGDVLAVAQVAGIMGAKKTSELIPMCHPLALTHVDIRFSEHLEPDPQTGLCSITITATVKVSGKTGVEMEALTAVSHAALTIYDMCKAVDRGMFFNQIGLLQKSGGKSGTFSRKQVGTDS